MTSIPRIILALAAGSLLAVSSATAQATSNTWNTDAAGNWTDVLNWQGDTAYAEGADNTATFGNFIGADRTVTLDAAITIGNITASDTTHNYIISGANTLTLDRTTGTPAIDVITSRTLTIASDIAGSDGLQKTGAGTLILSGLNNTYSGTTTLAAGSLQGYYGGTSLNPVSPFGASSILLNGGTLQLIASGSINSTAETVNFGNDTTVGADATIYVNRVGGTASNKTLGLGTLTIGANTLNVTAANVGFSAGFSAVTLTGNVTFNPSLTYATLALGSITQSGGSYSLTKTGVGTLKLTGTNDYSGGTVLNGGTVVVTSNAALGAATTAITVSGSSTLNSAAAASEDYTRAISLGIGSTLTINNNTTGTTASFSGAITGSGNITVGSGAGTNTVDFSNTGNNFTGDLSLAATPNSVLRVNFASIGDAGAISLGKNGYTRHVQYTGSSNLVLDNRRLDLSSSFSGVGDGFGNPINMFANIGSGTVTLNANMTVAAGKTGTFFFGGTNTGDNTFAGIIPNSAGGTLTIATYGTGKWIFTKDNTYAGNAIAGGGILSVGKIANAGVDQPLGLGSTIQLGYRASSGTLEFTGSSSNTTDKQVQIGDTATNQGGTGGIINNGSGTLTFSAAAFNNALAGVTVSRTLTLGGSNTGANEIQGVIQNNNSTTGPVALTKSGSGTWVLSGANTYTGLTTVSAGTLVLGHATNTLLDTGAVSVNGANAVLSLGSNDDTVGAVTLTNGSITGTGGTLTATSYAVQSGAISANLGASAATLTKTTTGVVTLSGNNAYTGITTISAGVLRLDSANALPGGIGATGGTSALTFNTGGVLGLGAGNFTRPLAAAGTVTAVNFTGDGGWAAYGADRFVNLNNDSHQIVWATANTGLNARTLYLGAADATHTLDFQNPLDLGTGTRTVQVADGTAAVDAKLSGILSGGTNGALTKTGSGTLQLTAANSYTGTTTVSAGTLMLSGSSGVIASTSRVAINAGATLQINNTSGSDNLGDRLNNAATVAMTSGILNFSHTGAGGTTYSETTGPVTISGTGNRIISSQAATGRTSTLTLGGLSGTLTGLQFEGPGLGDADLRNRILITGRSAGAITGATHYDPLTLLTRAAVYSIAYGVGPLTSDANVDVLGGVIPTGSDAVSIIQAGSSGDITLSSDPTIIASLTQTANQLGTVAMPGQTLRTDAVLLGSPNASLTIATSPGSGTLTPRTSGGSLTLSNNYTGQLLTINAVIADNGAGSSLAKNGAGTVLITAGATYTGATEVSGGTLTLTGAGSLPDASAVSLLGSTSVLHLSGISTTGETIGPLTGVSGSSVVLGGKTLSLNGGAPATFAGVISGSGGAVTLLGGASQTLSGDNTFTGNVTIGTGSTLSVDRIQTSGAQPLGQGSTPIVLQGNVLVGSTLEYTGAGDGSTNRGLSLTGGLGGTVNVTAGTLTVNGALSGSANFHKAGAGMLVLSGSESWNADGFVNEGTLVLGADSSPGTNALSGGNWTVATGATMRLNTTGSLETSTLTRNGTFNLEAGTLRTNAIAGTGPFVWGAGTITPLSNLTQGMTDRTDPGGAASGPVVREGNILGVSGSLTTSNGSTLDLGGLFTDNGLRYNQVNVSGALSLAGTDELKININPYLLRPTSFSSVYTGDWGTLRLVIADSITGEFDTITGIGPDYIGFSADPGSGGTDTFINPGTLAMNTYYIEYRTSGVLSGAAVLFHYKVAGSVPEPGSAGLIIAGASLIRLLRRRLDNEGSDFFRRRRKMIRRRRFRSQR